VPKPMSIKIIHRRERTQKATREKDMHGVFCLRAAVRDLPCCVFSRRRCWIYIYEINARAGKRLVFSVLELISLSLSRALNGECFN
jgi:hypothetical protein